MAQVHGATDGVTLLAASSRLVKSAKQWYEFQGNATLESWVNCRQELIKYFERKVPFYIAMQRIEARKWSLNKDLIYTLSRNYR